MFNSLSIMRNVVLASVLEPIPNKKGCTTRYCDWQDKSKLEYFLIAGVNIGEVFYKLYERIIANNLKQPKMIYDLAYEAQLNSFKNRKGGKINFGIIELLIPIVTAQVVYQNNDITVLDEVEDILKNTSNQDVEYHWKFRKIAREVSRTLPNIKLYDVNNLYDYYKISKNENENNVHKEYISQFKRIKEIFYILEKEKDVGNLLDNSVVAYDTILEKCNNFYGLAADYVCVAIYLYLSKYPDTIII